MAKRSGQLNKGFTLVELMISVGLLVMVVAMAGVIFRVSIDTYKKAAANAEIMAKLRGITSQLEADFKGIDTSTLGVYWRTNSASEVRSDCFSFLANGDFQTTLEYPLEPAIGVKPQTIHGNVAIITYIMAGDPNAFFGEKNNKVLVRRQTVLVGDWVNTVSLTESDLEEDANDLGEYVLMSPSEWKTSWDYIHDGTNWMEEWSESPSIDVEDANDMVMYMAEGVDDFTLEYVGSDGSPYENSHEFYEWRPSTAELKNDPADTWDKRPWMPVAIKVSFTLYDSKGILPNGKRFSQVFYLD